MNEHQRTVAVPAACLIAVLAIGQVAFAGSDEETWSFDELTTGQDIAWVASTNVDPNADQYDSTYEITLVEVGVEWLGIPFGSFDVTDQIPAELLSNSGSAPGPAPITILNESIIFPEPPATTAVGADLLMGINGAGNGFLDATNIVLGTYEVDLGFPIGVQTVDIVSLRVAGQVTVAAINNAVTADLDGDGTVGPADLAILLGGWGPCPGLPDKCPADLDGDGAVGAADLAILLGNWG